MSGASVGGIIGGVVGFIVSGGNPLAAQIGFALGSMAGGAIAPEHIKGPSIGDAQSQTAAAGVPRPVVFGHPAPFAGNLIDGEKKARKIVKEVKQGKGGGPVTEEEHFLLTSAIRVCEAAPGGIDYIRIWCDGVVVYDARTEFPPGWEGYSSEVKSKQAAFLKKARLYRGTEDQLPDPALEALHGVGKTPYYRGTAYIVVEDDDRTSTGGAAGQWMFEVTAGGSVVEEDGGWSIVGHWPLNDTPLLADHTVAGGVANDYSGYNLDGVYNGFCQGGGAIDSNTGGSMFLNASDTGGAAIPYSPHLHTGSNGVPWGTVITYVADVHAMQVAGWTGQRNIASFHGSKVFGYVEWCFGIYTSDAVNYYVFGGFSQLNLDLCSVDDPNPAPSGRFFLRHTGEDLELWKNGKRVAVYPDADTDAWPGGADGIQVALPGIYSSYIGAAGTFSNLKVYYGYVPVSEIQRDAAYYGHYAGEQLPEDPNSYYDPETGEIVNGNPVFSVAETDILLSYVEQRIMERCGIPAGKIDVSDIDDIVIPGFLIGDQISGADCLTPLMWSYFHDLPEYDGQIKARLRGGATVLSLTDEDFMKTSGEEYDLTPQAMEFPAKLSVVTQEPEADYSPIPQTSFRFSPDIDSTSEIVVELAVPLPADNAKQVAEKLHKVKWSQAESFKERMLPGHKYSNLIPTDPISYGGRRWMVVKTEFVDNQIKIRFVYDRASNYSSNAVGQAPTPPEPPTGLVLGPTICVPFNSPSLRTQDNVPGFYIAAQGVFTGYQGADIYVSIDGGETYSLMLRITQESVIGYLSVAEPTGAGGEPIVVRLYDPNDELVNVTAEQLALGQNAAVIVNQYDVAEIIGFLNASQNVDGTWNLTGITRSGLGTTEVDHLINQKFSLLKSVYFLPMNASLAGQTLYIRPVTIGTLFDQSPIIPFLYEPNDSLFEVGPHLRVDSGGDYRVDSFGNRRSTP